MSGLPPVLRPWSVDNPLPTAVVATQPPNVQGWYPPTVDDPLPVYVVGPAYQQPAFHGEAASPAPTSSANYVMMGVGLEFIPIAAGRGIFTVDGQIGNAMNGAQTHATLVAGTGAAPVNGDPLRGIRLGQPVRFLTARADEFVPFSRTVLLDGLVAGMSWWVDVAVRVDAGTSILSEVDLTGFILVTWDGTMAGPAAVSEDCPEDGRFYARRNGAWVAIEATPSVSAVVGR